MSEQPPRNAYDAWKHADARAREAEQRLAHAWDLFDRQLDGPPAETLLAEVSRLRSEAHEYLRAALAALDTRPKGPPDHGQPTS